VSSEPRNASFIRKQLKKLEKEYWITDLKFDDERVSFLFVDPSLGTYVYRQRIEKVNIAALLTAIGSFAK